MIMIQNAINNYIDHLSKKIEIKINFVSLDEISENQRGFYVPLILIKKIVLYQIKLKILKF